MAIPSPSPVTPLPPMPGVGPDWYKVALYQKRLWDQGVRLAPKDHRGNFEAHVVWDEAYFNASPRFGGTLHTIGNCRPMANADWCSAFVNYCLHRAGYCHTGNSYARSWLDRGLWSFRALAQPRVGCVIVVGAGGAHVGLLASTVGLPNSPAGNVAAPAGGFDLLGGNQGEQISVKKENRVLIAATDSDNNRSPYLWPLRSGGNCNIGIATAAPHNCGNPHQG